jgi:hypothetical protein
MCERWWPCCFVCSSSFFLSLLLLLLSLSLPPSLSLSRWLSSHIHTHSLSLSLIHTAHEAWSSILHQVLPAMLSREETPLIADEPDRWPSSEEDSLVLEDAEGIQDGVGMGELVEQGLSQEGIDGEEGLQEGMRHDDDGEELEEQEQENGYWSLVSQQGSTEEENTVTEESTPLVEPSDTHVLLSLVETVEDPHAPVAVSCLQGEGASDSVDDDLKEL